MFIDLTKKILNHSKYLIFNINYIITPINLKNLIVDIKIVTSFILCDLKTQFFLKKRYFVKIKEHKNFLKQKIISNDWFTENIIGLEYFKDKEKLKKKNLNVLEIGSYQGNSTIYFLNNLNIKKITCVDNFEGSDEHDKSKFNDIYNNFMYNTSNYKDKIVIKKCISKNFFKLNKNETFDLIYIDGSHHYEDVLIDAFESIKILNKNGYLVFDDFLWKYYKQKSNNPINAIKLLIKNNNYNLKILFTSYQIILKKND